MTKSRKPQQTERVLGSSHKVMKVLGEGAYGVVMKCRNIQTNKMEAVKMYKQRSNMAQVAKMEIGILKRVKRLNSYKSNIVQWNSHFFTKSSICLTFELLDRDLASYVHGPSGARRLNVREVRPILHQLTTALFHLKSIGVIHADVKPENVLCVDQPQQPLQVKLGDFGLARLSENMDPSLPAQTLWYRAPEVLVGHQYNEAIDMWSLGAMAAELVLGTPLHPVTDEYNALRAIGELQGQPPDRLLDNGMWTEEYYVQDADSPRRWTLRSPEFGEHQMFFQPAEERHNLAALDDIQNRMDSASGKQHDHFLLMDLIKRMLHLDPAKRIEPLQALLHRLFTKRRVEEEVPELPVTERSVHTQTEVYGQVLCCSCDYPGCS